MAKARERDVFWSTIPLRGRALFFGAVFCVFAPAIIMPVTSEGAPLTAILFALVCSGLIGMFWAMAFTRNMWFLAAALGVQAVTMFGFARFAPEWAWPRATGFSVQGTVGLFMVVLGYTLFILFINTEGKRSVRERTELALAQQIHGKLVPPVETGSHGYDVLGRSMPSSEVGGDLIDVVASDDGLDLYLGDVTGHGVRSGVVMAMTKSAIHTARRSGTDLAHILSEINEVITELTDTGIFVTFASLRLRPEGRVTYGLAGHLPIMHWRAAERRVERLDNEALPLGVMGGQEFAARNVQMDPGDLLVVLTDGFIEVEGDDGAQLGLDGFERLVESNADLALDRLFDAIVDGVRERGEVFDDQTLLLVRRSAV